MIYALILYVCGFIIMFALCRGVCRIYMTRPNIWMMIAIAFSWPLFAILVIVGVFNSDFVE